MDSSGVERRGVAVVLLSYNRPKMLEHAWRSIIEAMSADDAVIFVDDGSDAFDPEQWASEHGITLAVRAERRSVDRRMTQASLGRLINGALFKAYHRTRAAAVAYLCDDDLFAPTWLDVVRETLASADGPHVCRGRWRSFDDPLDGDPMAWPKRSRPTPLDVRKMTTGNFAHRIECYIEGLRWSEETVAVHDDTFLWRMLALHAPDTVADTKTLAGYRREHPVNMANFTTHAAYGLGAYEVLSRGALE